MTTLSLSGLASGVDTDSIVQQLMDVERQGLTRVQNSQTSVTAHQTALKAVSAKLNALSTAAQALTDQTTWKTSQTTSSSDASKVGAVMIDGAGIGGHTVAVDRLASSAQHGFAYVPSGSAGTFTISAGTTSATISVAANATAKDVATAINASTSAPVYAAVVKDDDGTDRVVLSSRKTGASNDFTVDSTGLQTGQLAEDAGYARTGAVLNAQYRLDGASAPRTSESNSIENAIPGLRLTLAGVTTSPVSITTNEATIDKSAIKDKVKAFVDAYNAVVDVTRSDISEKGVVNASATADLQKGTLFGDLGLNSMLSTLKNTFTQTVANIGGLTSLADIGISTPKSTGVVTEDAKAGKLEFDATKLDAALDKDWTQVNKLFNGVGARKGFGLLVNDFVKGQTGLKGVLTGRMDSDSTSLKDLANQVTSTNLRLSQTETRLKAQFAAMETALQNAQAQQAWLQGQIASLG
ncbi:flagellar filament capping protein FliD [Candidatus Solirubrobacter pratensis]|uniref:flagellar filament capping protein FliD n=1 Tax=Candidatus Solirubrobacter pratensis TaxID=1298857 RepID=UPI00040AFD3E|nr:flagellar filament capping protein FliD [Candidatus Solirubrobacter pratensis]